MIVQPLLSVLMTAYNREKYIVEAIESVLASTYTNFELIIVDDCSNDTTPHILRHFAEKDNRVSIYFNKENLGDYPNRNKAATYAKGEYIMFVDSDDMILKDGFEKCINAMEAFPKISFGMYYNKMTHSPFVLLSEEAIRKHFFETPFLIIGPGGTIQRRFFFNQINGYPEKYGPANDMYYNLKAVSITPVLLLPHEFMYYRRHEGQEINNSAAYLYQSYIYFNDALNDLNLPLSKKEVIWLRKKNKRRFAVNIIKYFFKTQSISETRKVLKKTDFGYRDFFQGVFH